MRKKIGLWLCFFALLYILSCPVFAVAVDVDQPCRLTLHYTRQGTGFSGLEVRLFRVAEYFDDGSYALTGEFTKYPVKIHAVTAQSQWRDATQTLTSYVEADGVMPTAQGKTEASGTVVFENLKTGLYLIGGVDAETSDGRFRFAPFLIFLPSAAENGEYVYDMEAKPKPGDITPVNRYRVIKLWKDSAATRPQSVIVDILKDGKLQQTVSLGPENNWSYQWQTEEVNARWSLVEKDVADGYTVTISQQENTFTIVNTAENIQTPTVPPQTGDFAPLPLYAIAMGVSGMLLLILVVWRKREQS